MNICVCMCVRFWSFFLHETYHTLTSHVPTVACHNSLRLQNSHRENGGKTPWDGGPLVVQPACWSHLLKGICSDLINSYVIYGKRENTWGWKLRAHHPRGFPTIFPMKLWLSVWVCLLFCTYLRRRRREMFFCWKKSCRRWCLGCSGLGPWWRGEHRYTVYMYLCVYLDIQDRETLGYYFLATIQRTRYVSQLDLPITYSIQVKNYIYIVEFTVYRILKSYICNCLKKRSKFGVFWHFGFRVFFR